jgi:hypothetical protein
MRRPPEAQARVSRQLIRAADRGEPLITIDEAASHLGVTVNQCRRYVTDGVPHQPGLWLDAFHRPGVGWLTSMQAVVRLCRELAEREESERLREHDLYVLHGPHVRAGDAGAGAPTEHLPHRQGRRVG